jgi:hypothetical protein
MPVELQGIVEGFFLATSFRGLSIHGVTFRKTATVIEKQRMTNQKCAFLRIFLVLKPGVFF